MVLAPDELRNYVDVSVRVFVCHVFVQLIANCAMATFDYSAFHIRISTYLNLNVLLFQHVFKNSSSISVRTQIGRLRRGFEYFARIDRNAELTAVHVFDRSGKIGTNF